MNRTTVFASITALRFLFLSSPACMFLTMFASIAHALPWAPMTSANPGPSILIPTAKAVPGKDFSDILDRDEVGAFDPEQVVAWDGLGGVRNSFDYSGTRADFFQKSINIKPLMASLREAMHCFMPFAIMKRRCFFPSRGIPTSISSAPRAFPPRPLVLVCGPVSLTSTR